MEPINFDTELFRYSKYPDFQLYRRLGNCSLVFGYTHPSGERRVRKYLFEDPINYMESQLAIPWYQHLGYSTNMDIINNTLIVDMPWLGYELRELVKYYEKGETAQIGFFGFTPEKALTMLSNTYSIHEAFVNQYDYLHLDFWMNGGDRPFNITYHPDLDYFPFIDAESFTPATPESWAQFDQDFVHFTNFVMTELIIK